MDVQHYSRQIDRWTRKIMERSNMLSNFPYEYLVRVIDVFCGPYYSTSAMQHKHVLRDCLGTRGSTGGGLVSWKSGLLPRWQALFLVKGVFLFS